MDKLRRSLYRKKKNVIKDAYCFLDINDIVANKEQPRTHFEDEKIQRCVAAQIPKKVVYVSQKLLNIVV